MKMKTYDNNCQRFLEESRSRRKNASLVALATRKENCHHGKHGKHHNRFNETGNLSNELTSDENQHKVVKLKLKFNLKKELNDSKTLRKYKQNEDYDVINRLQRMPCKVHGSFQHGNYAAAVCSRPRCIASSNDTCFQKDYCKSRMSRTVVCLINSKRMSSETTMVKRSNVHTRLPFTNNVYKERKSENKICIKLSPSFDTHRIKKVQHIISAFNNVLRSCVPKAGTGNTTTGGSKDNSFDDHYVTKGQFSKTYSYKINMLQRCLDGTSENVFREKLKTIELSKYKGKINKHLTPHNSLFKDVNRTKYCSSTFLNKYNVKKIIGLIGGRSDTNTSRRSKGFLKREVDHYSEHYITPLKCHRRAKDHKIDFFANKKPKKISHGMTNHGHLRYNKYVTSSEKCKLNSFASSMLTRDPFISCYKGEYNVFNLQYIIPKNKLSKIYTNNDVPDFKKYEATKPLSLHEIHSKNTDSYSNYSKSATTWYNRPNSSLISYSDIRTKSNNEYRRETPFCFEIPPIQTHAVHVKLKCFNYEGCSVPTSENTSLCCHTPEKGEESFKSKNAICARLTEEKAKMTMHLRRLVNEGKRARMLLENYVSEKKRMILCKVPFLNIGKLLKTNNMCIPCPNRRQFPKDVGFRTCFNFNIGIRKIPRIKLIKSSSKCDSGKHLLRTIVVVM